MHRKACWVSSKAVKREKTVAESGKHWWSAWTPRRRWESAASVSLTCVRWTALVALWSRNIDKTLTTTTGCVLNGSTLCFNSILRFCSTVPSLNDSTPCDLVGALKDHVYSLLAWVMCLCTSVPGKAQRKIGFHKMLSSVWSSFGGSHSSPLNFLAFKALTGSTSSWPTAVEDICVWANNSSIWESILHKKHTCATWVGSIFRLKYHQFLRRNSKWPYVPKLYRW